MRAGATPSLFVAANTGATERATRDLVEELRRRLRASAVIAGGAALATCVAGLTSRWSVFAEDPVRLVTRHPFPGVTFALALIAATNWLRLSPRRRLSLGRLRATEWIGLIPWTGYFLINLTLDLREVLSDIPRLPLDLSLAHSALWGFLIVSSGVMIPSTVRHAAARTAALVACSFVPDLLVLPGAGPVPNLGVYLMMKMVCVAVFAALGTYGAYRIEMLRQDAQAARQLGQYVLGERLGAGGMGEVHLAEHRLLRRPCAVKLIRPEQAGDEATLARFEREVRTTATLTHPNTIQIYDYGRAEDGTFYYAMEYLPGESLEELVAREGPLEPARAARVLAQLCGALREAHGRGLVHRDIKPGNVMLCERGGIPDVAKLLDFGLVAAVRADGAEADARLTQVGMVLGTPAFMSPEQCAGDEAVGPASDIYAVGALGYFLLTGRAPFAGRSPMQMLAAHLYETPRPVCEVRPEVPAALSDVIARCLAKAPAERYGDAGELEGALKKGAGC